MLILTMLFVACKMPKVIESKAYGYTDVLKAIPQLKSDLNKCLKRHKIDSNNCYIVPEFRAHLDTTPSRELFISGAFIKHLQFNDIRHEFGNYWYLKDSLNDVFYHYGFGRILPITSSDLIATTQLKYENNIEFSFTVGFVVGENVPIFVKSADGFFVYYYNRTKEAYEFTTIVDFIDDHPEFIENMPLPLLKLNQLKKGQ